MSDAIRIFIVASFVILAITLPVSIRVHARNERRSDARLLAWTIWALYAAGIFAVLGRFGEPLPFWSTALRLLTVSLGYIYIARNLRRRAPKGKGEYGRDWS